MLYFTKHVWDSSGVTMKPVSAGEEGGNEHSFMGRLQEGWKGLQLYSEEDNTITHLTFQIKKEVQ